MKSPEVIFTRMLFELMDQKGITTESEFARELEIPCTTVNQWTCMKAVVRDHSHIWKLCKYFDVTYEYLLFGIGLEPGELDEIYERQKSKIEELEIKLNFANAERDLMANQLSFSFGAENEESLQ